MKIAITSGKGGVGKTLVATCLAAAMADTQQVCYIDCDVEAPNAHLFLKPGNTASAKEFLSCIESIDLQKCTFCGQCVKVCYFNALAVGKKTAMTFPELCRWCGACLRVCPTDALVVGQRKIGVTYQGQTGNIKLLWATLAAGAGGMTVRLIEQLKSRAENEALIILDSPPGTSCSAVHTIRGADCVILVTDPTRFGQYDFKLSVHLCRSMDIEPLAVINRAQLGDLAGLRQWCRENNLQILAELPDSRDIAELYSQGILPVERLDNLRRQFADMAQTLIQLPPRKMDTDNSAVISAWQTASAGMAEMTEPVPSNSSAVPTEITIVSGKGGTGKTSLCACFAQLAQSTVADCDVDAADMHLLLEPSVLERGIFHGGRTMRIDPAICISCGRCADVCQWKAITRTDGERFHITEQDCEGCGTCLLVCPVKAISTEATEDGTWYWSSTRFGSMSHAMLEPGKENSGKLVTLVRKQAVARSHPQNGQMKILLDGSPGTGCPVIASIGGAAAAIIVTEPTVSGLHDMERILELIAHFRIRAGVIINKADLNLDMVQKIKNSAATYKVIILGELSYDLAFVDAQQTGKTILEYQPDSEQSDIIRNIWKRIQTLTEKTGTIDE
jgi:MinD superfamily P-loop ATPase